MKTQVTRSFRPRVENLEDRCVPAVITPVAETFPEIITEYTQVAEMFPRHQGPTTLYLNFDGWQAKGVAAYQGYTIDYDGDPAPERNQDIQEIIFRVSEVFSPFDVQVRRIYGDGVHGTSGGHSTIFVGDRSEYGSGASNAVGGGTPIRHSDFPGRTLGLDHVPNSNPFDIGFADPTAMMSGQVRTQNNSDTVKTIAHEAGHTFGLGHTLSGVGDAAEDLMRYDNSSKFLFADDSLPLTTQNGDGSGAVYVPHWLYRPEVIPDGDGGFKLIFVHNMLQTQNSFRILTAGLGERPADDFGNVMHHQIPSPPNILTASASNPFSPSFSYRSGTIDRYGDFDVFQYTSNKPEKMTIEVKSGLFLGLESPQLLVFDEQLQNVKAFSSVAVGLGTARVTLDLGLNERVTFAVGGRDGNAIGSYELKTVGILESTIYTPPGGGVYNTHEPAAPAPVIPPGLFSEPATRQLTAVSDRTVLDAVFAEDARRESGSEADPDALTAKERESAPTSDDVLTEAFTKFESYEEGAWLDVQASLRR